MTTPEPVFDDPATLSIEALDTEIVSLTQQFTTQEYQLLVLIRTFDERGGWLKWGSPSCAEWLHWRCDLSLSAAREKIRVAHALKVLPKISAAFAAGDLTYSKARALTRVATAANEDELLAFALNVSASLVEQRCQQLRNVHPEATDVARRAHDRRVLSAFREPRRGAMTLTVEIPLEDGELVLCALDKVLAESPAAADASPSYRTRQADALLVLCRAALAGDLAPAKSERPAVNGSTEPESAARVSAPTSNSAPYQVVVHVDAAALGDAPDATARSDLPAETVRRLTCDGTIVPLSSDDDGSPLNVGRKRRTVPVALKRAVFARDRHCRFPGCGHARFVDVHHVEHWARGGETSLENLLLLCGHHHRLVHEGGFQIAVDNHGTQFFRRPDGRAVPACGYRRADQVDDDADGGWGIRPSAEVLDTTDETQVARCAAETSAHASAEGSRTAGHGHTLRRAADSPAEGSS